jgi:hypothetical protein
VEKREEKGKFPPVKKRRKGARRKKKKENFTNGHTHQHRDRVPFRMNQ